MAVKVTTNAEYEAPSAEKHKTQAPIGQIRVS